MDIRRGMGILPVKGLYDPLAHSAAVLIIGLRQHDDELRWAAPGDHIALAQAPEHQHLEIFYGDLLASLGKLLPFLPVDR